MATRRKKKPEQIIVSYRYRVISDFTVKQDDNTILNFNYDQLFDDYKKARQLFDKLFKVYDKYYEEGNVIMFNRLFFERIII